MEKLTKKREEKDLKKMEEEKKKYEVEKKIVSKVEGLVKQKYNEFEKVIGQNSNEI